MRVPSFLICSTQRFFGAYRFSFPAWIFFTHKLSTSFAIRTTFVLFGSVPTLNNCIIFLSFRFLSLIVFFALIAPRQLIRLSFGSHINSSTYSFLSPRPIFICHFCFLAPDIIFGDYLTTSRFIFFVSWLFQTTF